jgi:hypothetical protein
MHEAFWNGLFDVRWEEAPLGPEAIRLVQRLRERGYAERTCRDPLPARKVKAAGTPAKTSSNGSKTSEPPKVMLSSVQPAILLTPADPRLTNTMTRRVIARSHNTQLHITVVLGGEPLDQRGDLGADRRPSRPVRVRPLAGDQAAVPAQDSTGGDQPVQTQPCWQEPDQRGEDCAVSPVEPGPGIGAAKHGDLVPQDEQLGVLGSG